MAKGNPNIEVVKKEPGRVEIRVLSAHWVFTYDGKVMRIVSKFKPGAQVYDPEAFKVPEALRKHACRLAAAILKKKQPLIDKQGQDAKDKQERFPFFN